MKSSKITNLQTGPAGTILMETVIALALFIILLGGVMWIGDLISAKNKLVVADRFAAWNAGNRHFLAKDTIQDMIEETFFPAERVGEQDVDEIVYEKGPSEYWSTFFGARVDLEWNMPPWTERWIRGQVIWHKDSQVNTRNLFTGRDHDASEGPSHSALLMRTRFSEVAYRTWDPISLADWSRPWDEHVYLEAWPEVAELAATSTGDLIYQPPEPPPPPGFEHERHDAYVDWSE